MLSEVCAEGKGWSGNRPPWADIGVRDRRLHQVLTIIQGYPDWCVSFVP